MNTARNCLLFALCGVANAQVGTWSQLLFPSSPPGRYGSQMVYDSARDRMVLFSGTQNGVSPISETWENDSAQWILRGPVGPAAAPSVQYGVRAAYDSARQRVVAVLADAGGSLFEHWEWDGTTWTLRPTPTRPPSRAEFAMAYDSARQRTILHGGVSGLLGVLADTWEFDGTTWTQRSTGGPQNRSQHCMAFDAARGVTVLFGGHRSTPAFQYGDTWVWNGSYWFEHFGAPGPAARSSASMVYDDRRQRIVLTGGRAVYGGGGDYNDTWEWNGQQWTDMQAPRTLGNHLAAAFDTRRGRMVVFGGNVNGTPSNQTWSYFGTTAPVASVTSYGTGCAGPNGFPPLLGVLSGTPRMGSTLQVRLWNLPASPLNIPFGWIGFDNTQWNGVPLPLALDAAGFPGCSALLAPEQGFSFANANGVADWSITVPFLPVFEGLSFYLQGGVFVPGFNTGGLVFSNGLAAVIGR